MASDKPKERAPRAATLLVGALAVIALFRILGLVHRQNYLLDLGSIGFPAPRYAAFLMSWAIFGTLAVGLMTWGVTRLASGEGRAEEFARDWQRQGDARWLGAAAVIAMLFALLLQAFVVRGARLTDDEAAYRFMAELIASGRLSAPSPPMKLFFDNAFMINDGRLYAKYFVGWPALLAPGVRLGIDNLMNPLYFALTVPPLYFILKPAVGVAWARAGVALLISAPMLLIGASTLMSHTSCMCALAWAWYFALRTRHEGARLGDDLGFALLLAIACFIRPISAIGIGIPLGLYWLASTARKPGLARLRALGVLLAVGLLGGAVFAGVNLAQTGDALTLAYQRMAEYEAANQHRFSALPEGFEHVQLRDPLRALSTLAMGMLRLSFALFGWPIGFAVALFALGRREARLAWFATLGYAVVHLPVTDPGIDTFGPVHYYEIALPLIVLCIIGLSRLGAALSQLPGPAGSVIAPSLLVSLVLTAWLGYVPVRAAALVRMSADVLEPERTVEQAGLQRAVVFSPRPWAAMCRGRPTRHFVFFRPNNDPDLQNDVLWVNQLGLKKNRALMRHFPDRTGYVLVRFTDCSMQVVPLEDVSPALEQALDEAAQDIQPPAR